MALPEMLGALDLYTFFVNFVFGSFWMSIIGLVLIIFIILLIGRMSIYTTTWYIGMFVLAMTLGYGYVTLNILITLFLLVSLYYSWSSWMNRAGQ